MKHLIATIPETVQGIALMIFATVCFTSMQSAIRIVAEDPVNPLHPLEIVFLRNVFGVIALAPVFVRSGVMVFRTRRLKLHFARALVQSLGMMSFFVGLTLIPFSEVTALSFSAPLFATVLAVLVMGERVRIRRISALLIGFAGVLVIVQPGAGALSIGALLILGSSFTWAIAMTVIKSLSRTESSVTTTLYAGLFMAPLTMLPALYYWTDPTAVQFAWLLGIGISGSVGHVAFAQAFKLAEMSAVLPLDFLRLVWASAFGYFLFGEIPSLASWTGGLIIFASASYIAIREARLAREAGRDR